MLRNRPVINLFRAITLGTALTLSPVVMAIPVTYTFTTNASAISFGTASGIRITEAAYGSFTYDSEAPYLSAGNGGAGALYGGVTNFELHLGENSAQDSDAYAFVANDYFNRIVSGVPTPVYSDLFDIYAGPTGGAWSSFMIGGFSVDRIVLTWPEGPSGDFISDTSLPTSLPGFGGYLFLDFGPITGPGVSPSPGGLRFDNLRVTPVGVPEPQTNALLLLGLLAMGIALKTKMSQSARLVTA